MSIRVMTKVWDSPYIGGGSDLLVMLALADWSDDDGRCWPAIASIAGKIRLGEKQTRRVVHGLVEAGFIEVTAFHQGGFYEGSGLSRRYRIVLDALTPPSRGRECPPSRGCPNPPPVGGSQYVSEPPIEPSETLCAEAHICDRPDWLNQSLWDDYTIAYKAEHNHAPSAWETKALRKLADLIHQGHDQEEVLLKAINNPPHLLLPTKKPNGSPTRLTRAMCPGVAE